MTRLILLLGICAALAGCATSGTSHVPAGMRVATSDMVSGCKLLGDIHGVSSLYGVFAESALSKARQQAFEQARSMGANTVFWVPLAPPYGSTRSGERRVGKAWVSKFR